jgi:DNA-binding response OmpR family regulator
MARVLICDPHADISALLELVVRRLGHEPVAYAEAELDHIGVDAAVIEPGVEAGMRVARRLRAQNVPVLFTSIYPAEAEMLELAPAAYLVKPFPLYALERALCSALEPRDASAVAPSTATSHRVPRTG